MTAYLIPDPANDTTWIIGSATEPVLGAQTGDATLINVHPASDCAGRACVVHNPSDHHMRTWRLNWRSDRELMERSCPHGVGHPDPDGLAHLIAAGHEYAGVHGCDGCCAKPVAEERGRLVPATAEYLPQQTPIAEALDMVEECEP